MASTVMQPDTGFDQFFGLGRFAESMSDQVIDERDADVQARADTDSPAKASYGSPTAAMTSAKRCSVSTGAARSAGKFAAIASQQNHEMLPPQFRCPFHASPHHRLKWPTTLYSSSTATSAVRGMCLPVCSASPFVVVKAYSAPATQYPLQIHKSHIISKLLSLCRIGVSVRGGIACRRS